MASDPVRDQYPGRPIRPLPKRRLRERLSPEAADKIVYPPTALAMSPVFFYPYNTASEDERAQRQHPTDRARQEETEHNYISRRNVKEVDSDEDYTELAYRSRYARRHSPYPSGLSPGRSYRYAQKPEAPHETPAAPASPTSSADGYDSFENTNNKKKRKIPTPGDAISNGILHQNDLASLGIASPPEEAVPTDRGGNSEGQSYRPLAVASSGGLSGSGRGRLARLGGGRSPFRSLAGTPNNGTRSPKSRQAPSSELEPASIISTAISNAENYTKEDSRQVGSKRNGSVLDVAAAQKPNPRAAQFTFTCDSEVPGSVPWPGRPLPSARNMGQPQSTLRPERACGGIPQGPPRTSRRDSNSTHQTPKDNAKPAVAPKKKRPTGREYLIAARERRERQERQNFHHPPALEDQWICEFCEYERIFGTPPVALIRQYEIKDRRIRKQEAERRRLLEKAKMKGRKSKKGPKPTAKSAAPCQTQTQTESRQNSHAHAHHHADEEASNSYSENDDPGDPEEEFIDDQHAPPLVHRMTQTKPLLAGTHSRPKAGTVQGGTGSSERLAS